MPRNDAAVITVSNLEKTYYLSERSEGFWGSVRGLFHRTRRGVPAVRGVTFDINPGELVAFLGPNGAGKTTTLKMLSGLLYPTGGAVRVFGHDPFLKEPGFLRRFSFVMGQRHQLWWELPALDTFRLNAAVFDIDRRRYHERLEELDAALDLKPLWNVPVKKLSLGQRMKMELACSLLHDPELLLLDEPTLGLDVIMQKTLRDFVARLNREKGTTVLLTSHNMADIETLCRRVIVIHGGQLLFDGALDELVRRFVPDKKIRADLSRDIDRADLERFGRLMEVGGGSAEWLVPRAEAPERVGAILKSLPVADLTVEEMPLEDVVRRIFSTGEPTP